MLGIGFFEMIIIAGIALVVIGPEKFPDFAKLAVRTIRELRSHMEDLKTEVNKELKPVKDELRTLKEHNPEKYIDSLSKPVLTPSKAEESVKEPPTPKADTAPIVENAPIGENEPTAEADSIPHNPEPDGDAWQRQEYKVAGGDEFVDADFKSPERMD